MSKFTIEPNIGLFATYVGLTISGYDLADKKDKDIAELCGHIRKMDCHKNIIDYFDYARTNPKKTNPYWPRGSLLSSACFFISVKKPSRYETFDEFVRFTLSLSNINPEELNNEVIAWLKKLPLFIDSITGNDDFNELRDKYQRIIKTRTKEYTVILEIAQNIINNFQAVSNLRSPDIVFSPNLLQSPYIADFVIKDDQIVIIKTAPEVLSIIHEFLHTVIRPIRYCFNEYIQKYDFRLMADTTKLSSFGYMWNRSEESKTNVLEESFVRGLSIAITAKLSNSDQIDEYIQSEIDAGFKLVPIIVLSAKNNLPNSNKISDFIIDILDSVSKHGMTKAP